MSALPNILCLFFFPPSPNVLSFCHATVSRWKQLLQICHSGPSPTRVMCQHWLQKISILISDYALRRGWWTVFPLIVTHLLIITIWCDLSPFSKAGPSFVQMFKKRSAALPVQFGEFWSLCGQLCFSKCSNQKKIVHLRGTITSLPSVPLQRNCLFLVIYNRPILPGTFASQANTHTHVHPSRPPPVICVKMKPQSRQHSPSSLSHFFPRMHSFSSELDLLHDVVNLPKPNGQVVDSPPSAFHQQHPQRSRDASAVRWKMWTHSSLRVCPCPQTLALSAGRG